MRGLAHRLIYLYLYEKNFIITNIDIQQVISLILLMLKGQHQITNKQL